VGVEQIHGRCDIEPVGEYMFFYAKKNENTELGTGFFVHKKIIAAVKRVEFVSDGMKYRILNTAGAMLFMPQQKIKLKMYRIVSMRNWKMYSIHYLNVI
jgi:hypothetical protein